MCICLGGLCCIMLRTTAQWFSTNLQSAPEPLREHHNQHPVKPPHRRKRSPQRHPSSLYQCGLAQLARHPLLLVTTRNTTHSKTPSWMTQTAKLFPTTVSLDGSSGFTFISPSPVHSSSWRYPSSPERHPRGNLSRSTAEAK